MNRYDRYSQPVPRMDYEDYDEDDDNDFPDLGSNDGQPAPQGKGQQARTRQQRAHGKESDTPMLDRFARDITAQAAKGQLDPVVGREKELIRIAQILSRRKKNNPVLIGEPGVGKTAIIEALAQRIVSMQVPPTLFGKRLLSLDLSALVAGTKFRGQFEERMQRLIKELTTHADIILFIDEIHTLIGTGSAAGSLDAANMLKPALSRGMLQCIGATTVDEYRKSIEKDGAMERRFQKVMVAAPDSAETLHILQNIKSRYEEHHCVTYTDEALKACVTLTDRYVSDRQQPDKAIDALDEAGSRARMTEVHIPDSITNLNAELDKVSKAKHDAVACQDFEKAGRMRDLEGILEAQIARERQAWEQSLQQTRRTIGTADIEQTVSLMSGVPVQRMASDETVRLRGLKENLNHHIIAQDEAIAKLVKAIARNRMGLRDPNKPIGTFMFLGPTGIGKTYLAQQLAEYMFGSRDALIRIDMSEYMEKYSTSRLVGAPPGYVGYDEGGQLTEKVRRRPYSIVLLDEIEKANHDVFNLLLQVLDEGRLTDASGNTIDFKNTIIIFTSNSGSREVAEFGNGVGFGAGSDPDKDKQHSIIMKSLHRQFAPEFINRIDDIILFNPLTRDSIGRIARLELDKLQLRIRQLGYSFTVSPGAMDFIVAKSYDPKYGARPLKRALQTYVEDAIGQLIMEEALREGDVINISKRRGKDELQLDVVHGSPAQALRSGEDS